MKTVVLLMNLGSPDSPNPVDVRKYLSEFLNDSRVINLPWLFRKLLVNLIIVPVRSFKSARLYRSIWTPQGSPLVINTQYLSEGLQNKLGEEYVVEMAMRYGNPGLKNKLVQLEKQRPDRIILVPLYPQYSSATTGSTLELAMRYIGKWKYIPSLQMIHHFHDHPAYIKAFAFRIHSCHPQGYDHIIMSYHGLPLSHIHDAQGSSFCYQASCFETSKLLARELNLKEEDYTVSFQSRLNGDWTKPFTDEAVRDLAKKGKKRILVVSPSFTSDCLETLHELGKELKKEFEENGGEQLTLVESLNDLPIWVDGLAKMIAANG
ncbi:MAG: ferrochelatase [Porphyromonadaceae bacterium]|nr:MAG: ferrochelatase [Porphyromonadaceae bacterium]